jgi:hypothetical protein
MVNLLNSGRMRLLSHGRLAGPQLRWGREKFDSTTRHFMHL